MRVGHFIIQDLQVTAWTDINNNCALHPVVILSSQHFFLVNSAKTQIEALKFVL